MTSAWFEPGYRGGGPVRSVAAIVDTVHHLMDVVLVTSDRDLGDERPYDGLTGGPIRRGRCQVNYLEVGSVRAWWRLLRDLRRQRFNLLYVNSLWDPRFSLAFIAAARVRLLRVESVLVAPRGELAPGAMSLKPVRKLAFLRLARPVLRPTRVKWHASTNRESSQIRHFFPGASIMVVAPQSALAPRSGLPATPHAGAVSLVFLSRITAKKNLELVIRALKEVTRPADLDIYGPITDAAYWDRCLSLAEQLPKHVRVTYRGEVPPAKVHATFARYDAFIFPTLGESFGHVIAESLAAACPVLCSATTPWTAVLLDGGGTVVTDPSLAGLTKELERLAAIEPAERHRLRAQAGDAYDRWRKQTADRNVIDEWWIERLGAETHAAAASEGIAVAAVAREVYRSESSLRGAATW